MGNNNLDRRLAEETVEGFLAKLGSGAPTPGGGAAAALSSALGASLLMMVANHTIGKKRYAEFEDLNIRVRDEAEALRGRFVEGIDADAEAFKKVSEAYAMPISEVGADDRTTGVGDAAGGNAEALKERRSAAIADASVTAAEAPLKVMEDSLTGLQLAQRMLGHSNPNLGSDILVAALSFNAGLVSASYNVEVNLAAIRRKHPVIASEMKDRSDEIIGKAALLTGKITGV